ncbi:putative membrane protein [Terriglobus roseus DSM 18391]|uniref:Putative membrane protein n=1 Tax=Terriglobus roseus (strain DSM 18391 / NRRL B-41598 / KBS 63) TaxID=926566 RepID=I3ZIA4_TERRK|nr:TRIC cation channel family protein [Terriglobus roseus]AFL88972.1 putative membrane protein [Terriglobus roseus DSM 18391]
MALVSTIIGQFPQIVERIPLPPRAIISQVFFHYFEIAAISLGALGGALSLRRDRSSTYDVIGLLGLGLLSGVGGGIIRDVLLGDGPPLALQHPSYLAYALCGATIAIVFGHTVGPRMLAFMNIVDALALGLFTVAGSTRAMNAGLGFLPCLMLGVATAVGGGSLRDLFSGRSPAIFQEGELYALVATFSAAAFLGVQRIGVPVNRAAGIGTLVGFGLRLLAIRYGWRTRAVRILE